MGKWAGRTSEQTWQFSQGLKDHMLSREFISFNGDGTGTYTVDFDFTTTHLKAKLEQTLSWQYIKMVNEDEVTGCHRFSLCRRSSACISDSTLPIRRQIVHR